MQRVRVIPFNQLSPAEATLWDEWQAAQRVLASPYFCRPFLGQFAALGYPVEVAIVEQGGEPIAFFPYQRSRGNIATPVGGALSDFHGIIGKPERTINLLPILQASQLRAWDYQSVPVEQAHGETAALLHHSHFLDLSNGFPAYCKLKKSAGSETVEKTQRKERAFAREHRLAFEFHNSDPQLLQLLIRWKLKQNIELGVVTPLSCPRTQELLSRILQESEPAFGARLSVLRVDEQPAALSYSLVTPTTAHCWFLGFDEQYARYSPGLIQLLKLAEAFANRGVGSLHLGKGNERFKTSLATGHILLMEGVIGPPSTSLVALQLWHSIKQRVKSSPLATAVKLLRPVREWFRHGRK